MANLQVKDGAGVVKYLKALGAGTDPDPHIMQQDVTVTGVATAANQATTNTALAAIQTAVQLIDNAVSGSEFQVDVLSSALPTGAATAANQATEITALAAIMASLDTLDGTVGGSELQVDVVSSALPSGAATAANQSTEITALAAIQTAVQLIDNAVAGSEFQVDVLTLPALVAGTANIGDVDVLTLPALVAGTANIGDVDVLTLPALVAGNANIGDVDIATITAGETHIGKVSTPDEVFDLTLTLDTSAYADGDLLADTQSIASVARVNAGIVILESVTIIDEDDQGLPLTLIFLDANNTLGSENSAPSVSDANARNILGFVRVTAGDYIDLGGVRIACVRGIALEMKMAAASTTIYVGAVLNGVGTYTASGLKLKLGFLRS